jgi:hypothetical protein
MIIGLVIGIAAAAEQPVIVTAPGKDPVICKRSEQAETGSRMAPPRVCKRKSQWAFEENETQRLIEKLGARHTGTPTPGRRE